MKLINKALLGAIISILMLVGPVAADDKVYTIKFQSFYSPWGQGIADEFVKIIEDDSQGRVKIQRFSVGEIAPSPDMLKAIRSGVLDFCYAYSYNFPEMPLANVISGLPMSWMSSKEADEIFLKYGLEDLTRQAYAEQDVVYLGTMWTASYLFLTKQSLMADLRKWKIRAAGGSGQMLHKLGISTVQLPNEDLYVALQTGQIDGILWGAPFEYMDGKFYEAAGWLCLTPVFDPSNCGAVFNAKT